MIDVPTRRSVVSRRVESPVADLMQVCPVVIQQLIIGIKKADEFRISDFNTPNNRITGSLFYGVQQIKVLLIKNF